MASPLRRGTNALLRRLLPRTYRDMQVGRYASEWVVPRPAPVNEQFLPTREVGHLGIELNVERQLERLRRWGGDKYQALFRTLRQDPAINRGWGGKSWGADEALHNGYYPTPDAEVYAAMILDAEPGEIVEVGSGYSTLVARHAIKRGGLKTKLTVIDPNPRTDVRSAADEVVRSFVEDSGLERRQWAPRPLLFIDSSHVCRSRGDLPLLFCQVVPGLPDGTTVHVHDIFLPYDYPTNYDPLCYSEQYLLHALLSDSPRYRTTFATHYLARTQPAAMQRVFGPLVGTEPIFNGASYWFDVAGGRNGRPGPGGGGAA